MSYLRAPSLLLLAAVMVGCDIPNSSTAPDFDISSSYQVQQESAAPKAELVRTPNGWYHQSCVREIPTGASERRDGTVTTRGGRVLRLAGCRYPGRRDSNGVRIRRAVRGLSPDNDGWIEYAYYSLTGHTYSEISARWVIPSDPLSGYSGDQVYYTFPGLMSSEYILQPVLQYGYNGAYGGNYWTLTAWRCNAGSDCTYSSPLSASVGDTIHGVVSSENCGNGECDWTVLTHNLTADTATYRSWSDTVGFYMAVGGALEVNEISSCGQYPRSRVSYGSISMKNESGTSITPTWTNFVTGGLSPFCNFSVNSTSTTVQLDHFASLAASITGDDQVAPNEECGWQAQGGGGIPPYSYTWWGALSGNGQLIQGEIGQSSWLWVAVVDSRAVADTAQFLISVNPAYSCDWR